MKTWRNVVRYHLVNPWLFLGMPWAILTFVFTVLVVVFALIPPSYHTALTIQGLVRVANPPHYYTGAVAIVFVFTLVLGINSIGRSLPFGMALGLSRRSYYTGTALLGVAMAASNALLLTGLQAIEQATNGWGVQMHLFRVPYILQGPWYVTWLTCFVALALMFVYGMWFGIVYRRWNLTGSVAFIAAQVTVVVAVVAVIAWADAWSGAGHFFTDLTVLGLTGLLAGVAVLLLAGGHATIRRATV